MPEFPFNVFTPRGDEILVRNEGDLENCLRNGCGYTQSSGASIAMLKAKIAEARATLCQLESNLAKLELVAVPEEAPAPLQGSLPKVEEVFEEGEGKPPEVTS